MAINRRQFLAFGLGSLLAAPLNLAWASSARKYLSCFTNNSQQHFFALLNDNAEILMSVELPARGHGSCTDTCGKKAAVFARRPGDFVWIIDLENQQVTHKIAARPGRHFYGHGLYSVNNRYLFCSENDYENGNGIIGVYDAEDNYKPVAELPSHGIGPHEFKLLNDDKTLVIANGGIRTHPDLPRVKANLDSMRPNLAYIDIVTGKLLDKAEPPEKWHQLSIRHIDVDKNDSVAMAMQYQGKKHHLPPLVATHKPGQALKLLKAPEKVQKKMRNYCGSVAFNSDQSRFAVTSPRGGIVTFWSADGSYLGKHKQDDACGIVESPEYPRGFVISDGNGGLTFTKNNLSQTHQASANETHWDNHMTLL